MNHPSDTTSTRSPTTSPSRTRCAICRQFPVDSVVSETGDTYCGPNSRGRCNFHARRRLHIPLAVCMRWLGYDAATAARAAEDDQQRETLLDYARKCQLAADWLENPERAERTAELRAYMQSDDWRQRRLGFITEAEHRCRKCDTTFPAQDLDVHHKNYRTLGTERLNTDVEVLCSACHLETHGLNVFSKFGIDI